MGLDEVITVRLFFLCNWVIQKQQGIIAGKNEELTDGVERSSRRVSQGGVLVQTTPLATIEL